MTRALTALTIGPLEPGGRDGVLADLATFSSLGLHGAAAITSSGSADDIVAQIEAVLGSMQVDAVKLTCPPDALLIEAIAGALARHDVLKLVLDPGGALANAATAEVVKNRLLPRALVAVPNVAEARVLSGREIVSWDDVREAARAIAAMGAANVVVKGRQREGDQITDILFDGDGFREYTAQRVHVTGIRGVGTTFAAALTATLAKQETVHLSIAAAKAYVTKALQDAYALGGEPALHHFYRYWRPSGQ
jgi:hydroxymethylpyrimidine/phosphomethylpyrimidine kinase